MKKERLINNNETPIPNKCFSFKKTSFPKNGAAQQAKHKYRTTPYHLSMFKPFRKSSINNTFYNVVARYEIYVTFLLQYP